MIPHSNQNQINYEARLHRIEDRLEDLEKSIKTKTDSRDVIVKIDELIKEKELITKAELNSFHEKMQATLNANQVSLLKWMVGTGISTVAAIAGVIRLFII